MGGRKDRWMDDERGELAHGAHFAVTEQGGLGMVEQARRGEREREGGRDRQTDRQTESGGAQS